MEEPRNAGQLARIKPLPLTPSHRLQYRFVNCHGGGREFESRRPRHFNDLRTHCVATARKRIKTALR